MGQIELDPGTCGRIGLARETLQPNGKWLRSRDDAPREKVRWRARAKVKASNGEVFYRQSYAPTKNAAENALKAKVERELASTSGADLTPETLMPLAADRWLSEKAAEAAREELAWTSLDIYRRALSKYLLPRCKDLKIRQMTHGRIDQILRDIAETSGHGMAKTCRSVLSGIFAMCRRLTVVDQNPVLGAYKVARPKEAARALRDQDVVAFRAYLADPANEIDPSIVVLTELLLATGARIGEAAALSWRHVNLDRATVRIERTVVRRRGLGLLLVPPKSAASVRTLHLGERYVDLLRAWRERDRYEVDGGVGQVLLSPSGTMLDPNNAQGELRNVFAALGLHGYSSHSFRKTLATRMVEGGIPLHQVADQLGHSDTSMTLRYYVGRADEGPRAAASVNYGLDEAS